MTGRVVVVGVSGAGKTTLAKRLESPYVDMNAFLEGPAATLRVRAEAALARDAWAADASLEKYLGDRVLERADTVVWLDLPLRVALVRLWRRSLAERELPVRGTLGALRAHFSNRRRFPARLAQVPRVVHLRSVREVDDWSRLRRGDPARARS